MTTDVDDVRLALARMEAKLDVSLAQHSAKLERHDQEIGEVRTRVTKLEDLPRVKPEDVIDHETRLRTVEQTPTVSPRQLGAAAAAIIAAVSGLSPLLERLYS